MQSYFDDIGDQATGQPIVSHLQPEIKNSSTHQQGVTMFSMNSNLPVVMFDVGNLE